MHADDSTNPEFWNSRYANGKMPWDFHGVPKSLRTFLQSSTPGNVLIPGCGAAYEAQAFHATGWKITAIGFSPVVVKQARAQLGDLADRVILGDLFKHDFGGTKFDVIYERTFLCALPPELWPAYADRMTQLLRPSGLLAGIFLHGEESEPPPYPLNEAQARDLFGKRFSRVQSVPVDDSLPLFAGKER